MKSLKRAKYKKLRWSKQLVKIKKAEQREKKLFNWNKWFESSKSKYAVNSYVKNNSLKDTEQVYAIEEAEKLIFPKNEAHIQRLKFEYIRKLWMIKYRKTG
jgi:hypothetical protein